MNHNDDLIITWFPSFGCDNFYRLFHLNVNQNFIKTLHEWNTDESVFLNAYTQIVVVAEGNGLVWITTFLTAQQTVWYMM